jgi:hypothetical protein
MKKFLATLAATALFAPLLFSVPFVSAEGISFADLSSLNPNYVAINTLVSQGVLKGYEEDGTFRPDNDVTRAEAVKILLAGMDVEINEESTAGSLFSDVDEDDWFFPYVGTAVSLGIIKGYSDNTFKPHSTVNRAEAIKMLTLAAGVSVSEPNTAPFADVGAGSWFAPYASYAKTWNIEPPQSDGLWHASAYVSRANISEMVYRMQLVQANEVAFEESTNWLSKDFPTVDISMKAPFGWNYKQDGVGAVWTLDEENNQLSLLTPYENGGTLLMTRNSNSDGDSYSALFNKIEAATQYETLWTTLNGYRTLEIYHEDGIYFREWYVYLDNGTLVHFLALRGEGYYADYLEDYIEAMVVSVEYQPDGEIEMSIEDILGAIRSAIQVDGTGNDAMDLLDDWELIETDSIGVGTGPVDYYYSASANITVKYERSYDVILAVEDGQTSAF